MMEKKEYHRAFELYSKALVHDSLNGKYYYKKGLCAYYMNDTLEACEDWQIALKLGETHASNKIETFCK